MALRFYNGQVLLKDVNTDNWYYLSVVLNDEGVPTESPAQEPTEVPSENYSSYGVLRGSDGNYYKVVMVSVDSQIIIAWDPLTVPEPTTRILLKESTTGVYYELILVVDEGQVHFSLRLVAAGGVFPLPWKPIISVQVITGNGTIPAPFETKINVITPV